MITIFDERCADAIPLAKVDEGECFVSGIKEINIEVDESVDVMEMDFSFTDEITIPITLSKKSKKIWGKILMMPKYVITEWCFPRKKKRGTMRRNRRKGGDTE